MMTTTDAQDKSDSDLLAAVATADMVAFEALYRLYERRVYQYAYTFVRDRAAAEEVAVDTMTTVWRGAAGFAGRSRASTWILGIARHKALDVVRKGAQQARHAALEEAAQAADPGPTPSGVLVWMSQHMPLGGEVVSRGLPSPTTRLRIVFQPTAPEQDIRRLLLETRARIVAEPSADGVYIIEVPATDPARIARQLAALRGHPELVSSAEQATP